ncbi:MAG: hypothetical protein MJA83_03165 [Gammaproteobacteria bacterium]|nr:hypothetical protein [Gammaproteobacteria bacterium]
MSKSFLQSTILGDINADEIVVGKGVRVEEGVYIGGKDGPARKIILGDFSYIGRNVRILTPEFCLGDYSKLHADSFVHGVKPLQIGRNCWIGGNSVLDSLGGLDIDDNVGIGAQSQIWTHIQFGDIVQGNRFYSERYMHIGRDAWFVGHCIVSPISVGERAMALVGSVVTRDMEANHVYAGVPATDVTDKVGPQFETITNEEKKSRLNKLIHDFEAEYPQFQGRIKAISDLSERDDSYVWFDVSTRTYKKKFDEAEIKFLQKFTPLVKFIPEEAESFFIPQN